MLFTFTQFSSFERSKLAKIPWDYSYAFWPLGTLSPSEGSNLNADLPPWWRGIFYPRYSVELMILRRLTSWTYSTWRCVPQTYTIVYEWRCTDWHCETAFILILVLLVKNLMYLELPSYAVFRLMYENTSQSNWYVKNTAKILCCTMHCY